MIAGHLDSDAPAQAMDTQEGKVVASCTLRHYGSLASVVGGSQGPVDEDRALGLAHLARDLFEEHSVEQAALRAQLREEHHRQRQRLLARRREARASHLGALRDAGGSDSEISQALSDLRLQDEALLADLDTRFQHMATPPKLVLEDDQRARIVLACKGLTAESPGAQPKAVGGRRDGIGACLCSCGSASVSQGSAGAKETLQASSVACGDL